MTTPSSDSAKPRRRKDLPGPTGLPLLGNALQFKAGKEHQVLEAWASRYGSVFKLGFGPLKIVGTTDPSIINTVLRERPHGFRRMRSIERVTSELGVRGVFSVEGAEWKRQRKLATGALNPRHLRSYFPTLRRITDNLLRRWERAADEGAVVDLQLDLMRYTTDVVTSLVFSTQANTLAGEESELIESINAIFPVLSRRVDAAVPYWRYVKLPVDRRVDRCVAYVRRWLSVVIEEARERIARDPERVDNPADMLEAMLVERDENGNPFSEEVIFGNAFTMLLAGEDTTANTLAWAVHLLLDAPAASQALRNEADEALGDKRTADTFGLTEGLRYATNVAHETLRIKPVAPLLFMEALQPITIGDLAIEPGTIVGMIRRPPALDPDVVDNPGPFQPERWAKGMDREMHRRGEYTPFGGGPRLCPGRSLALLEVRMVLAMLYKNFDVERVGEPSDVTEVFGFTMAPQGLRVRFRRRNA